MSSTADIEVAVVGSGLAGLTTAISLAENAQVRTVHLLEKEAVLGLMSNSNKASSGINGIGTPAQLAAGVHDTAEAFFADTLNAGKQQNDAALVREMVEASPEAIEWLTREAGVDLGQVAKLGGHSERRTHRGTEGAVGYSIIKALCDKLTSDKYKGTVQIHLKSRVTKLLTEDQAQAVRGLEYTDTDTHAVSALAVNHVVLATGGFSANKTLLSHYAARDLDLPSSNGVNTTGDGLLLTADLPIALVDMPHIQIHPTGFIDPADPANGHKVLAGEVLRGIGGVLLNSRGHRFVNELDTRDVVSAAVLAEQETDSRIYLAVPAQTADELIAPHVKFYSFKRLIQKSTLAEFFSSAAAGASDTAAVLAALDHECSAFNALAPGEADRFGRTDFNGQSRVYTPANAPFYIAQTTPVVHFCMGGLKINALGQVLTTGGGSSRTALQPKPFRGLYAAGEVAGGVHGANRLGGSSLLECVVFGRRIAQTILSKL